MSEDTGGATGTTTVTTAGGERELGEPVTAARPVHPYIHVIIVALIGAVAVLAWLIVFEEVNKLLWENEFVLANRWMFPVICLPFSLLVGLLVKYRHAPTTLDESLLDSLAGDVTKIDWRALPVNIVMAWASLFSGAVLGPEGGIGGIASKIAVLYSDKVGIPVEHRSRLVFSTLASAYNGLVASPLFTAVLGTELVGSPEARSRNLPANLIGGAIGYFVFFAVGSTGLQDYLHLPPTRAYALVDIVLVVAFGLVGLALALVSGALFRVAAALFGRLEGREVERALAAGVVFSAVGVFAPILLFSGETQIQAVAADPAGYGPAVLVAMALVKLALLAVAFKSGFLGGPTFPAIFASVCVALAISQLAPGIPVDVIIGGIMGGFLLVLFRAPLMVILLTAVMLQAGLELIALILLAVAGVMVALPYVLAAMDSRRRPPSAAAGATGSG
jgi:H+/Cl- antiporter ClcA